MYTDTILVFDNTGNCIGMSVIQYDNALDFFGGLSTIRNTVDAKVTQDDTCIYVYLN